jgi:hypothetical protein
MCIFDLKCIKYKRSYNMLIYLTLDYRLSFFELWVIQNFKSYKKLIFMLTLSKRNSQYCYN